MHKKKPRQSSLSRFFWFFRRGSSICGGRGLFQDLFCEVEDSGVFNLDDTAIGAGLDLNINNLSVVKFFSSEEVSHGLLFNAKFTGNASYTASGKTVFDIPELIESNVHSGKILKVWQAFDCRCSPGPERCDVLEERSCRSHVLVLAIPNRLRMQLISAS